MLSTSAAAVRLSVADNFKRTTTFVSLRADFRRVNKSIQRYTLIKRICTRRGSDGRIFAESPRVSVINTAAAATDMTNVISPCYSVHLQNDKQRDIM